MRSRASAIAGPCGGFFDFPRTASSFGMAVGSVGGGSVWLLTTSPIVPGETMTLELTIFDVGDQAWDSLVVLDDFEWSISPSEVGTNPNE